MIIHIKLNDVADIQIGVTQEMQQDMIECRNTIAQDIAKDCNTCSWRDLEFNDVGFCEDERIQKAVTEK